METEQSSDLARRAAVHAALADPTRLLITDALDGCDVSPSELATLLGMPSNLLSHHLNVLEQTGLISRHRSEGDRRRNYLRLIPAPPHSPTRPGAPAARVPRARGLGRDPSRGRDRPRCDRRGRTSSAAVAPRAPSAHR